MEKNMEVGAKRKKKSAKLKDVLSYVQV